VPAHPVVPDKLEEGHKLVVCVCVCWPTSDYTVADFNAVSLLD